MDITSRLDLRPLAVVHRAASSRTTGEAARGLADAGVPVFPCVPTTKRPVTTHGFRDASTDPDRVAWWWRRWPTANVAIPTGATSGIDVVDIDVHADGSGFPAARRARDEGLIPGWSLAVATPSGGMHLYFPHAPDSEQRSWQCPGVHVDFRGDGGYVVVPPSLVVDDDGRLGTYRVAVTSREAPAPVDAAQLRQFLDPRPTAPPARRSSPVPSEASADPDRLADWVATRREGGRNAGLFWASCRMVEADFDYHSTLGSVGSAAVQAGLGEREVVRTVQSAYRRTQPRDPSLHSPYPDGASGDASDLSLSDPGDDESHPSDEVVSI
ncbi:hypothetical protein GCM10028784_29940 [Myceligenerans cantabricum]